jgi:3-methyl-2-oxobutanoate hydroxymethyltransferase
MNDEVAAPYGTGPARSTTPVKRVRTHHLRQFKERG